MIRQALPGHLLPFCSRHSVVAVGVDGDPAPRQEPAPYLDILRLHQRDQILHDPVHAVLMEISLVPVTEKVQFQGLTLHQPFIRNIRNDYVRKVRLPGNGTEAGEFRTIEFYKIIILRMLVLKGFQQVRCISVGILCLGRL